MTIATPTVLSTVERLVNPRFAPRGLSPPKDRRNVAAQCHLGTRTLALEEPAGALAEGVAWGPGAECDDDVRVRPWATDRERGGPAITIGRVLPALIEAPRSKKPRSEPGNFPQPGNISPFASPGPETARPQRPGWPIAILEERGGASFDRTGCDLPVHSGGHVPR